MKESYNFKISRLSLQSINQNKTKKKIKFVFRAYCSKLIVTHLNLKMSNLAVIQNFTLPGEICRKFAVDWSQDNKISICTSKAVYIMTSYCSPVELYVTSPLHKQVIPAPEKVMQLQPISIPSNPYGSTKSCTDEVNLHQILMDHTLNPVPPERVEAFRGYRCAKWSPKGASKAGRCILATLTMDHRLTLYEEINDEWICICDLTEVLKTESEEIKEAVQLSDKMNKHKIKRKKIKTRDFRTRSKQRQLEIKSDGESDDEIEEEESQVDFSDIFNYEAMKARTYKLAPVEITWTGMFGSPASSINDNSYEYCYLIVAMKSGHIQFWKISSNDGRISIALAHEWDSGLGLLTAVCWQQTSPTAGFLMVGTLKGVFAFLSVTLRNDSEQEPTVTVKEMCKVWDEEDWVSVDCIAVLKIALKKYVIVAAKQHALVGCEILLTDSSIIIRNVGHSFGLHKLPVTGMCVLDAAMPQYRLLISTMEGLFVEIKITVKDYEIKFQHEKVLVNDLDLTNMMVQGLVVSPNGILCSLILSTVTYFDHLEKKEPLQFVMFITKSFEEIFEKFKNVLKPAFTFMSSSSGSNISRYCDFLECVRLKLANESALPGWLISFLDNDSETYKNASELELYVMRFLLHSYVSGLTLNIPKDKDILEKKLNCVESLIMKNYISKIFGSCQDKIDLLTPTQGQSVLLMADWLLKEYQMPVEGLYSALGCETPVDANNLPARETCRICKSEVKLENMKTGKCAKNHTFSRCCQSLLLCDIVPYHRCMSCKSVALQDVWSFGLTCTFCGMTMS